MCYVLPHYMSCSKPHTEQSPSKSSMKMIDGVLLPDTPITNPDKIFKQFARRVTRWKVLAHYLDVDDEEIERIDGRCGFECEKCLQMFHHWHRTDRKRSTYALLAEGFKNVKQEHLVLDLLTYVEDQGEHPLNETYSVIKLEYDLNRKNVHEVSVKVLETLNLCAHENASGHMRMKLVLRNY